MITEKNIENAILTYLKAQGIYCWKSQTVGIYDPKRRIFRKSNNPHHINGIADILGIYQGRFLAIEVKKPYISKKTNAIKHRTQEELEKLASDDQLVFLNHIKGRGGVAFMADNLDVVKEQLELWKIRV